jgi:GT2 family glycosyltransferase
MGCSKNILENGSTVSKIAGGSAMTRTTMPPLPAMMSARVLISIVTHNSERYLRTCLESLKAQTYRDFCLSIWDNASTDGTSALLAEYSNFSGGIHFSKDNLGFCTAHNRLIAFTSSEYNLILNPDVILDPRFLEIIIRAMDRNPRAGSATGKLWRWQTESKNLADFFRQQQSKPKILDTTGIYFTPTQRHFDRGSGALDAGQFDRREYVFGASGAAAVYRRSMLQDIADNSRYFDENFFAYREDADLAWRAQWMGWPCLYIPEATGYHVRRVLPERRSSLPDVINMHSFKNRFLLRIKNMDCATYARFFIPISLRDIASLVYVLIRERSSLPGIPLLIQAIPQTWAMRRSIQRRRRASAREIRSWFSYRPMAKPIPD